ncbi:hypothetical protein XENOCAPTIV_003785, partial [Xenoophorus captivus]
KAAAAGRQLFCPSSEAGPARLRRSPVEEAARLWAAADRGEGAVGEEPAGSGAAAAAVPAHRPRQGGRVGRIFIQEDKYSVFIL